MNDDIEKLQAEIKRARIYAMAVCIGRANLAGLMAGCPGATGIEFEFPEPDVMQTYHVMFGRRICEAATYRLSFGDPLKWVGVSHPWGVKPSDIVVGET